MRSVVQTWVSNLTFMQQAVLFASIRGPDGIHKDHVSKKLARWLRRCVLIAAFDGIVYEVPYDPIGKGWQSGSFTGPSIYPIFYDGQERYQVNVGDGMFDMWQTAMDEVMSRYMKTLDEVPHHYQLHFMHAAEILGYKHPHIEIWSWWRVAYFRLANDMHLNPETEAQMDFRLGDRESQWREKEEVTAA